MEKINVDGTGFDVCKINSHLKVAAFPEMAQKIKNGCGENFLSVMDGYVCELLKLPLAYKTPPMFSFVVLPRGDAFKQFSGCPFPYGMATAKFAVDADYPVPLAVDEGWFERGFLSEESIERKVGLCHELAHTLHSAWFNNKMVLCEGFAELLPHYLMNLESQNHKHRQAIAAFAQDKMRTVADIEQNGMFSPEDLKQQNKNTQEREGYMSVYLWMLGYTKRVEKHFGLDKFGAANLMLSEFEKLSKNPNTPVFEEMAKLVGLSSDVLTNTCQLQKEGQAYVVKLQNSKQAASLNYKKAILGR